MNDKDKQAWTSQNSWAQGLAQLGRRELSLKTGSLRRLAGVPVQLGGGPGVSHCHHASLLLTQGPAGRKGRLSGTPGMQEAVRLNQRVPLPENAFET